LTAVADYEMACTIITSTFFLCESLGLFKITA